MFADCEKEFEFGESLTDGMHLKCLKQLRLDEMQVGEIYD